MKQNETFRGDFSARNSDAAIPALSISFSLQTVYMYAVNIEPHVPRRPDMPPMTRSSISTNITSGECHDRALTLIDDPARCQVLPHMIEAEWDTLELLMESLGGRITPLCSR